MKVLLSLLLFLSIVNASDEEKYKKGEKIYNQTCLSCHGADGSGNHLVSFIVNPRSLTKTILTEEQSYKIVKYGAHVMGAAADIMPSFKSVLQESELRAVTYYMYEKFNPQAEKRIHELYTQSDVIPVNKQATMLHQGKKIYNRNCSGCHGLNGKGNGEATKTPKVSIYPYNLTKSLLDEKQMFLYVKYGGKYWGTNKNDMPSWSKKYDDYTLKSIVKYVKTQLH